MVSQPPQGKIDCSVTCTESANSLAIWRKQRKLRIYIKESNLTWMRFKSKNESGIDSQSGKNTGVGSHSLLQGILPTQSSNLGLPHCRQILYCLSCQGSPQSLLKKCKNKTQQKPCWRKFNNTHLHYYSSSGFLTSYSTLRIYNIDMHIHVHKVF